MTVKHIPSLTAALVQNASPTQIPEGYAKIGVFGYYLAVLACIVAVSVASLSIALHWKRYSSPTLQRIAVRIIAMVPIYAISALVSLSSHKVAIYLDTMRELYEAFVIYSFFNLLLNYLGGERHVLSIMAERSIASHLFPVSLFVKKIDLSDPASFLLLRRGVIQFVILRPVFAFFILVMKLSGNYNDAYISWTSVYLWTALLYNLSVFFAMYVLLLCYVAWYKDLKPFRPFPKFFAIKAIVFFSFWQGLIISFLVASGVVRGNEEYTADNIAVALQDLLICLEMVPFAFGHMYAFSHLDFAPKNPNSTYGRMPLSYAVRDTLGLADVVSDIRHALHGTFFRNIRLTSSELFEQADEDGETEFVLGSERRYYGGRRGRGMTRYGAVSSSVEVWEGEEIEEPWKGPEEDTATEDAYRASRMLVYGDPNYPVVADMGGALRNYPPAIAQRIHEQSKTIFEEVERRKRERTASALEDGKGSSSGAVSRAGTHSSSSGSAHTARG
ncbi:organic solute transporter Ostalpha-domain-containing protein [Cladochytrium replicatum]|nr:organic solute transporter Ostalpha-domain-containing protein [Cladochytrium replicatum]